MGWIGILIGSYIGSSYGKLPGSLIGAFIGYKLEMYLRRRYFRQHRRVFTSSLYENNDLADAYRLLGAHQSDSAETLKHKYRDLAKRYHPDTLRAQGLCEKEIEKATDRMIRLNAAWQTICYAREIK